MKKFVQSIVTKFKQATMKTQLIVMYFAAVFAPVLIVGVIMTAMNVNNLTEYHEDLLRSNNEYVKSVLYEITNQMYNISDGIVYDTEFVEILSTEHPLEQAFKDKMDAYNVIETYKKRYSQIEEIMVYSAQQGVTDYRGVYSLTNEMESETWYKAAVDKYSATWMSTTEYDEYGNEYWYLTLVRKIPTYDSSTAILMVKISDNYLKMRIEDDNYITLLSMQGDRIFYSPDKNDYGNHNIVDTEGFEYYNFLGKKYYHGESYLTITSTLSLTMSDSKIYVTNLSKNSSTDIDGIMMGTILVIILALALPAIIMSFFIRSINKQIKDLRNEMYKASKEDYNLTGYEGCQELSDTFNDLQNMVEKIQYTDAKMYSNQIEEQKLLNAQQKMEFKMLASQINPHFLYNTLEMIRMKAVAAKDHDTAQAIKLLGKTMRYVLDNTGTEYTSLAKEMEHIETYLQIQRYRFGDRVNYNLTVGEGIELENIKVLPLLLQPIVENAILHGLEEVESGGRIDVDIRKETFNSIRISISDNGCGMDEETLENMRANLEKGHINKRYGIGLYNINQRLRINYGIGYGITIDSVQGEGTTVSVRIKIDSEM